MLTGSGAPAGGSREAYVESSAIDHLADRAVERRVAGRRAQYGAEMRRIVDVTFALVERNGSLDPSMREILAEAGLSTQAFYRYFSSKDELMLALLDEGRGRLVGTLQRRMARTTAPAEQVRAWIEGVLAQATNVDAAARTRPWVLSEQRLAELFPGSRRSRWNGSSAFSGNRSANSRADPPSRTASPSRPRRCTGWCSPRYAPTWRSDRSRMLRRSAHWSRSVSWE